MNLLNLLPESDRTKEKLADLLEDRDLSFLFPLLRIQSDLWRALVSDPTPHTLYKYIKDTLDVEHHTAPGFINALMTVLVKYITQVGFSTKGFSFFIYFYFLICSISFRKVHVNY